MPTISGKSHYMGMFLGITSHNVENPQRVPGESSKSVGECTIIVKHAT